MSASRSCQTEVCPARRYNVQEMARYPSGKGEVCKTFMRRFDSDPRLQSFLNNLPDPKNQTAPTRKVRTIKANARI
jgi:hypothetical protein